jgi:hypothetical protein
MDLAEARARGQGALRIEVDGAPDRFPDVGRLRGLLESYRANGSGTVAGCRVLLAYRNPAAAATIALPDAWRVRPEDRLLDDLRAQPRVRAVAIQYA